MFVIDRLKELIKYKGRQVAPANSRQFCFHIRQSLTLGVIPSPDEEAGEVPKAFVVLKAAATVDEIMEFVSARVAPKRIRLVEFVSEIPKSPAGEDLETGAGPA